jgi:hypothetical protein
MPSIFFIDLKSVDVLQNDSKPRMYDDVVIFDADPRSHNLDQLSSSELKNDLCILTVNLHNNAHSSIYD